LKYPEGMTGIDPQRRAAALQALQEKRPATPPSKAFWERNGGRIAIAAAVLLALLLVARAVGAFMRSSISETARAEQELRKGLR
jgi:hypothetical protein